MAARWPALPEWWASHVAPPTARLLGFVPALVSWSVAETILYALPVALAVAAVGSWRGSRAAGLRAGGCMARLAVQGVAVAGVILLSFDVAWGWHYARPELARRMGFATADGPGRADLVALATALVDATNDAYLELAGAPDRGAPTPAPELVTLARDLDAGFAAAASQAGLADDGHAPARVKPFAGSILLSHLGLSGFFFPWTAEPNVNTMVPGSHLPHVAAHEMAHRRGFAREDEAQFAGYLACVASASSAARYSGLLYAQRELLGQLVPGDEAVVRALVARRVPGVQRDVNEMRRFRDLYEGRTSRAADVVNDAYLTAQGVPGGIASYRMGVRLLLLCARSGRTVCVPPFRPR